MATTLVRRTGTADAVALGLSAMLGSGVFAVFAPAAAAAGPWLLLAVLLAAVVALASAASAADLALAHPRAEGGYECGRARLHPAAGRLAGVAGLTGKTASAAAAAGIFGAYVLPSRPLCAAILVIVAATVLNLFGVRATPRSSWLMIGGIAAVLLVVVVVGLLGPGGTAAVSATAATGTDAARGVVLDPPAPAAPPGGGVLGVLGAAGLVFFAFVGFARVATAGQARTARRAVLVALGVATAAYLAVAAALLLGLGAQRLAAEHAPLVALVDTGDAPALGVLVRAGAAVAAAWVLLGLLAGVGRTALVMARHDDMPGVFTRVRTGGSPWAAQLTAGLFAIGIAVLAGPVASIALAACALLVHYAVVNLAALRLARSARRWPRVLSLVGLVGCLALAVLLPTASVLIIAVALAFVWVLSTAWSAFARRRRAARSGGLAPDMPQGPSDPPGPARPPGPAGSSPGDRAA